jgi:nitroreductase
MVSKDTDIFNRVPDLGYHEEVPEIDPKEFLKVIEARRSIRVFGPEQIPETVVQKCLDIALLAPTSSNLQSWEFYRIKTPKIKAEIVEACLSQPAAKTAQELIVCVARTKTWPLMRQLMLAKFKEKSDVKVPESALKYYEKLVPFVYGQGFLGLKGMFKFVFFSILGLFKPIPREPVCEGQMQTWAVKTSALACQNLMLAFTAYGYDTCPMEGFDSRRVKKILRLPSDAVITMVIGAGKRAKSGVYGPRIRMDRKLFVFEA